MSESEKHQVRLPDWFTPERVDTVIVAFADMYGRLMGKRMTRDFFIEHTARAGMKVCNYLLTVDIAMEPQPGFKLASWDQGYGDFHVRADLGTLRPVPWQEKTAIVMGDLFHEDGRLVEESPRRVLADQTARLSKQGMRACIGSELEFYLFGEKYRSAHEKGFRDLAAGSDYLIDYHVLHTGRDEDVLRRIRNEMSAAGITVECSKGEWGRGQHEVNLLYAEAMEMADRHAVYKTGAKEIADQQGKAISFMAKWAADQAGNGCHVHTSVWDAGLKQNLFWDDKSESPSELFRNFLGGLLRYSRELTYFIAPTVNSYKRFQSKSWAPTAISWDHDNRTCGFRIIGSGNSLRIENRMPGADANPYLAFASTLAAGLRGMEEKLDCGSPFQGNAYADPSLPRLPQSLEEAASLLEASEMARTALGSDVVDFYVRTAQAEAEAFRRAVTDWERFRYFEQL